MIKQYEPEFGFLEAEYVQKYMLSGGYLTEFKVTREFSEEIKNFVSSKYCFLTNNGTVSLMLSMWALGIRPGDEVLVPNFTMAATAQSVHLCSGTPKFVDVEATTLCIDQDSLFEAVSPKTVGVILVTPNGRYPSYDVDKLRQRLEAKGIWLLEDAAQSLGSFYEDGKHIGTKGIIGSFSLSPAKIISTGQGGVMITDSEKMAAKILKLKDFGRDGSGLDQHDQIGGNFKFTDLQAAVGLAQMTKLTTRVELKKRIYKQYSEELAQLPEVDLIHHNLSLTAPWFVDGLFKQRDQLSEFLRMNNIGTRAMYPPLSLQKAFKYAPAGSFPISEAIGKKGLWLPSSVNLTQDNISKICSLIIKFFRKKTK
jgi:perosamine synthetase